jgi:flotillin
VVYCRAMSTSNDSNKNEYLDQVMANQQRVQVDLKAKRAAPMRSMAIVEKEESPARRREYEPPSMPAGNAVDVRITGWGRWKTVIVPPNAYVVHTRRGHAEPLHIGLGVSFRYNPNTDSFLVVPGAMQTILINAHCICKELQGLLVQGYVQWIVADFATAYRKLDFTDIEDPMRVVNVQLREQAEAAIKDKVATMGIDDVLSDKQPIIEELTARLRHVAEGEGGTDKGLGLRIVTVQIKEAVVSSTRVWENLQKPFRSERARIARLAELEAETVIQARELSAESARESAQVESESALATLRARKEAEVFDREQSERLRRHLREQEIARQTAAEETATALATVELDKQRVAKDAEVALARLAAQKAQTEGTVAIEEVRRASVNRQTEAEIKFLEARQRVANSLSPGNLEARLIEMLPVVAEKLPKPNELRSIAIGGDGTNPALGALVAQVMGVVDSFKTRKPQG